MQKYIDGINREARSGDYRPTLRGGKGDKSNFLGRAVASVLNPRSSASNCISPFSRRFGDSLNFYRTDSSKKRMSMREPKMGVVHVFSLPLPAKPRSLRALLPPF